MALALSADDRFVVHIQQDERSAGFLALGIGLASGRPAVVLTTSGTAAVELHPAVVEAHHAGVPLLVCTADRPPELRDVGAPQTIDQAHLFGRSVRWFTDAGVPDLEASASWRSLAARAVLEATSSPCGPVHLNLPFREPLVGRPGAIPEGRAAGAAWHEAAAVDRRLAHDDVVALARRCHGRSGVIVAGSGIEHAEPVLVLAHTLGWPVLADPRSGCRLVDRAVIAHFDTILRCAGDADHHHPGSDPSGVAEALRPDVVLRLGGPPASKVLGQWLAAVAADEIMVSADGTWHDPARSAAVVIDAEPSIVCRELAMAVEAEHPSGAWLKRWRQADEAVGRAIGEVLAGRDEPTEPALAREVVAAVPDGGLLLVASSMPVRDVEWYSVAREGLRVLANRGANGIDGLVSTAVGIALGSGVPTVALLGDLAFIHDSNGLLRAAERGADVTIVVVDNNGGGIFSFLPQASHLEPARFEQLFGTPHGADLVALARSYGIPAERIERQADIRPALHDALERGGIRVIVVPTERDANVAVHEAIHVAAARALDGVIAG
jgi:2-succinyl-5-enolpyruvyl-6-hydroxy-3-cyclohexene-1-carboxylate synthase